MFPFSFVKGVPYLDLRDAAQVNSAVRSWHGLIVEHEFEVSIVFFSREIEPLSVVDQDTALNLPVLLDVFEARFFLLFEFLGR